MNNQIREFNEDDFLNQEKTKEDLKQEENIENNKIAVAKTKQEQGDNESPEVLVE